MPRPSLRTIAIAAIWIFASVSMAQQAPPAGPQPYIVGNRLGLPITPDPSGSFNTISPNVKVFGAIYSAESCSKPFASPMFTLALTYFGGVLTIVSPCILPDVPFVFTRAD